MRKGRQRTSTRARSGRRAPRRSPLKDFCRSLPGTTEDIKWGNDHMFSVGRKIYAGFDLEREARFGFKCDDIEFERLTRIDGIIPAPYAARFGWVSVTRQGVLALPEARRLLRRSYDLVLAGLPKRLQLEIQEQTSAGPAPRRAAAR